MFKLACSVALAFVLVSSGLSQAKTITVAHLAQPDGKVLVNGGEGFVAANDGLALKAGDLIMVGAEATAVVAFGNCAVALESGSFYRVAAAAPCKPGERLAAAGNVVIEPAFGVPGFDTQLSGVLAVVGVTAVTIGVMALAMNYDAPAKAISP